MTAFAWIHLSVITPKCLSIAQIWAFRATPHTTLCINGACSDLFRRVIHLCRQRRLVRGCGPNQCEPVVLTEADIHCNPINRWKQLILCESIGLHQMGESVIGVSLTHQEPRKLIKKIGVTGTFFMSTSTTLQVHILSTYYLKSAFVSSRRHISQPWEPDSIYITTRTMFQGITSCSLVGI